MRSPTPAATPAVPVFHERLLLFVLAAIQFTTILDFLIIMPLGPQYMRVFNISAGQFGLIVSSYAISAGISGVAAGFFLDRWDRRQAMLVLYGGFVIGTLLCALASTYPLLVGARVVAGAFGGVVGALILAVIGDAIPEHRRGAAMGLVMSSFSLASICGVPIGLFLASHLNWHVPFFVLAGLSLVIQIAAIKAMPSMRGHLLHSQDQHPGRRFLAVMLHREHQMAFIFMAVLTMTGFSIFPYISSYMVANVGLTERQLPLIYLCGGTFTFVTMNWIGRWADRSGKTKVFTIMSFLAAIPILSLTNLPEVPLALALAVTTVFMICMSGRMVPAMAMMTASVEGRYRGGFMSINSSVQQFSSGIASFAGGRVLGQTLEGRMTHFPILGLFSVGCMLLGVYFSRYLKKPDAPGKPGNAVVIETV